MPNRQALFTGTITNTGNIISDYEVVMTFAHFGVSGGFLEQRTAKSSIITVGPGEVVAASIGALLLLQPGEQGVASVLLNRLDPQPQDAIDSVGPAVWNEAVTVGGSLGGGDPIISIKRNLRG